MVTQTKVEIEGLDMIDVLSFIDNKKKKFIAVTMTDIESIIPTDAENYALIRKAILDGFNDYTRSMIRVLFGDIE